MCKVVVLSGLGCVCGVAKVVERKGCYKFSPWYKGTLRMVSARRVSGIEWIHPTRWVGPSLMVSSSPRILPAFADWTHFYHAISGQFPATARQCVKKTLNSCLDHSHLQSALTG